MYPQHGVLSTLQLCLYFATKQRSRIENETDRILHPLYSIFGSCVKTGGKTNLAIDSLTTNITASLLLSPFYMPIILYIHENAAAKIVHSTSFYN